MENTNNVNDEDIIESYVVVYTKIKGTPFMTIGKRNRENHMDLELVGALVNDEADKFYAEFKKHVQDIKK